MQAVIYTKDDCKWCIKAKELFHKLDIPFVEYRINRNITREEVLKKFPNWKTVPIIIIDDEFIGGYTELENRLND